MATLIPTSSEKREMAKTGKTLEVIRSERLATSKEKNRSQYEAEMEAKKIEAEKLKAERKAAYQKHLAAFPTAPKNLECCFDIKFISERSESHSETEKSRWSRSGETEFNFNLVYTTLEITVSVKGGASYTIAKEYFGSVGHLNTIKKSTGKSALQEIVEALFVEHLSIDFSGMVKRANVAYVSEKTTGKWETLVGYYAQKYILDIRLNWFGEYTGGIKSGGFFTIPELPKAIDITLNRGSYRFHDYFSVNGWTVLGDAHPDANQSGREDFEKDEKDIASLRNAFSEKGYIVK